MNSYKDFKFAVMQLDTIACEVNHNVHKAMIWTRRALLDGADYVFLHEGLTADYTPEPLRYGRSIDGSEVYGFCHLAKQYDSYVALGLNEVYRSRPYISMVWIGPDGIVGVYRKSYLWPNKSQYGPGDYSDWVATYHPVEAGYRQERGIISPGDGTAIMQVGDLRIGSIVVADDGTTVAKANEDGEEETIFANYADLRKR